MTTKSVHDLSSDPAMRAAAGERRHQVRLREEQRAVRRRAHQLDLDRVEAYSAAQAQRRDDLARLELQPVLPEAVPQWPDRLAPVALGAALGLCTLLPGAGVANAVILASGAALTAVLADRSGHRAADAVHGLQAEAPSWGWSVGCLSAAGLAMGAAALAEARQRDGDVFVQALAALVGASAVAGAVMIAAQWRTLAQARWINRKRSQQVVEARRLLEAAGTNYCEHLESDAEATDAAAKGLEQAIGDGGSTPRQAEQAGGHRSRQPTSLAQLADRPRSTGSAAAGSEQAA